MEKQSSFRIHHGGSLSRMIFIIFNDILNVRSKDTNWRKKRKESRRTVHDPLFLLDVVLCRPAYPRICSHTSHTPPGGSEAESMEDGSRQGYTTDARRGSDPSMQRLQHPRSGLSIPFGSVFGKPSGLNSCTYHWMWTAKRNHHRKQFQLCKNKSLCLYQEEVYEDTVPGCRVRR